MKTKLTMISFRSHNTGGYITSFVWGVVKEDGKTHISYAAMTKLFSKDRLITKGAE